MVGNGISGEGGDSESCEGGVPSPAGKGALASVRSVSRIAAGLTGGAATGCFSTVACASSLGFGLAVAAARFGPDLADTRCCATARRGGWVADLAAGDFFAGRDTRCSTFFLARSFSFDRSFWAAADLAAGFAAGRRVPVPDLPLLRPAVELAEDLLRVVTPENSSTGSWRDPECNSAGGKPTGARIAGSEPHAMRSDDRRYGSVARTILPQI